jgi:hypothetical protein
MIDKSRRKELQQQYAEREPQTGVFAVRNTKSGEAWVGSSRNIDSQKNGIWARMAGGPTSTPELQQSFKKDGADAFVYEILERVVDPDPHALERRMTERTQHWRDELKARPIKGT